MAARPIPRRDLPPGVTCALASGPLTDGDLRAIEDFKELLARTAEIRAEEAEVKAAYTARLKAMSPTDPMYAHLWNERADKVRELDRRIQEASDACMSGDYTEGATTP